MGDQSNIPVISERVSLNLSDGLLLKARMKRILYENQFIGSFRALDARPRVVSAAETHGRFEEIAAENRVVLQRASTPPKQRTSPVSVAERAVVHDGRRHALLV